MSSHNPLPEADPRERRALLVALRERMLAQKEILNRQVTSGAITQPEFARRVNGLMRSTMEEASTLLTEPEFVEMFGGPPGSIPILIPETSTGRTH